MMRKLALLTLICLLAWPHLPAQAAPDTPTNLPLAPLDILSGTLAPEGIAGWNLSPDMGTVTVYAQALSGTLDPALELLTAEGEVLERNDDIAPAFSTDTALTIQAGDEASAVRLVAAYGEGEYRVWVLPGEMLPGWYTPFDSPSADWNLSGMGIREGGLELTTSLNESRLFTPPSAPRGSELALSADITFTDTRQGSEAGLALRLRPESASVYTAIRLLIAPDNTWVAETTDITGAITPVLNGTLPENNLSAVRLGIVAQGENVAFYADGVRLGETAYPAGERQDRWGVEVINAGVLVDNFVLGWPPVPAPEFPATLNAWDSAQSNDITAELITAGVIPEGGQRRLVIPSNEYTLPDQQRRTYIQTAANETYDTQVIGAEVVYRNATDIGCGLVGRYVDEGQQVIAYADNRGGAGLLWWSEGGLRLNNYTFAADRAGAAPLQESAVLLLILHDRYAALYVNGVLTAQNIVPRRVGQAGVGALNYGGGGAGCGFRNFWAWG